jgi:FkbH-like protein
MHDLNNIDLNKVVDELYANQFASDFIASGNLFFYECMSENKIKTGWLLPLVKLVKEYVENGNLYYRKIYQGERLFRPFSPHISNVDKRNYLCAVLEEDIEIFSRYFGPSKALRELHDFSYWTFDKDEVALATLGDCLMAQINSITAALGLENGIGITMHEHYIGAFGDEDNFNIDVNIDSNSRCPINVVAISPFTYWGIPAFRLLMKRLWQSDIQDDEANSLIDLISQFIQQYVDSIERRTKATIFLHNSSGLPWLVPYINLDFFPWNLQGAGNNQKIEKYIGKINNNIDGYIRHKRSIFLIDERKISAECGRAELNKEILSDEILNKSIFHYNNFSFRIADYYMDIISAIRQIRTVKLLFVDFDNTLWSGNIAEGNVSHYLNRQKVIYDLYAAGILLVALSKNDENQIRWSEISFDFDCFAMLKINWNNKVTNIIRAAKELNISLDQTMVLDDSAQELGLIKSHLPQIRVLDSTQDSSWSLLQSLVSYAFSQVSRDINRTKLYQDNIKRNSFLNIDLSTPVDLKRLYQPLNIVLTVSYASDSDVERIYELLQRTNQFNCSGKKLSVIEITDLLQKKDYKIIVFNLKDNFGNMGLIGVVFIRVDLDCYLLENFVISCRAMGYGVEKKILSFLIETFLKDKIIKALLIETEKNFPARNIYRSFGFSNLNEGIWTLTVDVKSCYPPVDWITIKSTIGFYPT